MTSLATETLPRPIGLVRWPFYYGWVILACICLAGFARQGPAVAVLSNAMWVSSIESTAQMLAAPFRAPPPGLARADCPTATRLVGLLKGERFEVDATFRQERGRCVGELIAPPPLQAFFASASAWPDRRLRIVALADDGSLSRAALATPYGLYDLRATGARRWSATLNGGAILELTD